MYRRLPRSTRPDTRFPYTTLFRSILCAFSPGAGREIRALSTSGADVLHPAVRQRAVAAPVHFELGQQRAPQLMPWRRRKSSAASLPIDWTKLSYCHGSSMVAAAGAAETGGAPDAALRGAAMI